MATSRVSSYYQASSSLYAWIRGLSNQKHRSRDQDIVEYLLGRTVRRSRHIENAFPYDLQARL